jgi:hypothetical protein
VTGVMSGWIIGGNGSSKCAPVRNHGPDYW